MATPSVGGDCIFISSGRVKIGKREREKKKTKPIGRVGGVACARALSETVEQMNGALLFKYKFTPFISTMVRHRRTRRAPKKDLRRQRETHSFLLERERERVQKRLAFVLPLFILVDVVVVVVATIFNYRRKQKRVACRPAIGFILVRPSERSSRRNAAAAAFSSIKKTPAISCVRNKKKGNTLFSFFFLAVSFV